MDNDLILKKLISIEAWATGLIKECHAMRKLMAGDSSLALQKGTEKFQQAVARRNQRIYKNKKAPACR